MKMPRKPCLRGHFSISLRYLLALFPFSIFHNSSTENSAWQFGQAKYGLRKSTVPIILPSSVEKS